MADFGTSHRRLTAAGWSYRMNNRGWLIYRDPQTGQWYAGSEAIAVIEGKFQGKFPPCAAA
jgi:hypothetical protein